MPETPKPMVPVKVKHKKSGREKIINPAALERHEKAGYEKVGDAAPAPAAKQEGK